MALKYWWKVIITPSCWIQNHKYSSVWDKELNTLMSYNKFQECKRYTAKIGRHEVWIANHPYASFTPCSDDILKMRLRPSRATILKAMDKLLEDVYGL